MKSTKLLLFIISVSYLLIPLTAIETCKSFDEPGIRVCNATDRTRKIKAYYCPESILDDFAKEVDIEKNRCHDFGGAGDILAPEDDPDHKHWASKYVSGINYTELCPADETKAHHVTIFYEGKNTWWKLHSTCKVT